jgi:MazG family protein
MVSKIDDVIALIETLRGENGCPWDRKQTPRSMAVYLAEEVHELIDAVESGDSQAVCEELGDVLFLVLFIATLYKEKGQFNLGDVAETNRQKMIRRHPHVFGDETAYNPEQVRQRWREIKRLENADAPRRSILDSIPGGLPALMRAYRVSERAAGQGFDWDDIAGVVAKTEEEWSEFKHELDVFSGNETGKKRLALEFGDILFTLVNVARFAGIHPETSLSGSTLKFERRFRYMEEKLFEKDLTPSTAPRDELERLWEEAKKEKG